MLMGVNAWFTAGEQTGAPVAGGPQLTAYPSASAPTRMSLPQQLAFRSALVGGVEPGAAAEGPHDLLLSGNREGAPSATPPSPQPGRMPSSARKTNGRTEGAVQRSPCGHKQQNLASKAWLSVICFPLTLRFSWWQILCEGSAVLAI